MSSSNLVSIIYGPETVYGKPADETAGITVKTARFVSESLSGTPATTESAAIRTDRMSGGQVVTGLDVGGALDFELARGQFFDDFLAAGMMSAWVAASTPVAAAAFTPNPADDQSGGLAATGVGTGVAVGDVLVVTHGSNPVVTDLFTVQTVTDADNLVVSSKKGQAAITGGSSTRAAYVDIGATQTSFTTAKAYKDVTHLASTDEHSQTYSGTIVSGFSINAAFGSIVTGAFDLMANGYKQENPSREQNIVTGGGTITPAGTSNPLNASVDVPVVSSNGSATTFCIESFGITLDNGLTPQNCIGSTAPKKYELGTAAISIDASIYLGDQSYDQFMPAKLSQAPISLTFIMRNLNGGYAFQLPAVQLSFPDPSAGGQNSPVMIDASGAAKVGAAGESALRVYKLD